MSGFNREDLSFVPVRRPAWKAYRERLNPRGFVFKGVFFARRYDLLGNCTDSFRFLNGITNGGIEDNESVYFAGGTATTTWYLGQIGDTGFTTGLAPTDTMGSHSGWVESQAYSEGTHPAVTFLAPAGRTISSDDAVAFTANATVTWRGAYLTSNSAKGATTGKLWSTGLYPTPQNMINTQIFRLGYMLTGSSAS